MRRFTPFLLVALVWAPAAHAAKPKADLEVVASAPGVVAIGGDLTATAKVKNRGPASSNSVRLTLSLSGPFALLSVDPSRGSCSVTAAVVTCNFGKLSRGPTVTIDFELNATAAGDLRGAFRVRGQRADPVAGNNSAGTLTSVPRADCTLLGTAGKDRLVGTPGHDVICGLGGNDVLVGSAGNDSLYGGAGNDRLDGGPGNDNLRGEAGSDTATFKSSGARVVANLAHNVATGYGSDQLNTVERLTGSRYRDTLRGSRAANVLTGGGGADRLIGRAGNDKLRGNSGNDYLSGGRGSDRLYGAAGRDRCLSGLQFSC
jgi:Ca2+-binding RTX toxin-like protein